MGNGLKNGKDFSVLMSKGSFIDIANAVIFTTGLPVSDAKSAVTSIF